MPPKKVISVEAREPVFWAIKKPDGEPILRVDVQYQLLQDIFNDRTYRFTAPVDQATEGAPVYLNFDQLYLEAILSSLKTTTFLRQKLIENPNFSIAFCKLCLLINVGRINTTLAFYPNMRTALRTFSPIPSLQQDEASRKDLSDAPRIKAILKACYLDHEVADQAPSNLKAVAMKAAAPNKLRGPPTTVVTAIFLLFSETTWVTQKYLPSGYDLHDLFLPSSMASSARANAFLSLVHRILENPQFINDFDTPPPIILSPPIILLRDGGEKENVDTEEEIQYAEEMRVVRKEVYNSVPAYLKRDEENFAKEAKRKDEVDAGVEPSSTRKRRRATTSSSGISYSKTKREEELNHRTPQILTEGWEEEDWSSDTPKKSSLRSTWNLIKRDQMEGRDPDYESDDEALPFELLLRRKLITFRNPETGIRGPVNEIKKDFDERNRRKEVHHASVLGLNGGTISAAGRGSELNLGSETWYPGDEMDNGGNDDGEDD